MPHLYAIYTHGNAIRERVCVCIATIFLQLPKQTLGLSAVVPKQRFFVNDAKKSFCFPLVVLIYKIFFFYVIVRNELWDS
mgnify:CR=1 FL=1